MFRPDDLDRRNAEILSDLYLASVMGGMLGWCGYPVVPLAVVLATVNQLFLDGASARRASPDAAASAPISRSTPAPATARRRAARR